jgi:hypothetical protein
VNCGPQDIEHARDSRLIKKYDVIYTAERRNELHAFILTKDRPARIFDRPHRFIAIDSDNEDVAQRSRALQIPEVADVKNVEAPISEYDVLALQEIGQLFKAPEFHCASPLTASINSW